MLAANDNSRLPAHPHQTRASENDLRYKRNLLHNMYVH